MTERVMMSKSFLYFDLLCGERWNYFGDFLALLQLQTFISWEGKASMYRR